jgi:hypothetical protein
MQKLFSRTLNYQVQIVDHAQDLVMHVKISGGEKPILIATCTAKSLHFLSNVLLLSHDQIVLTVLDHIENLMAQKTRHIHFMHQVTSGRAEKMLYQAMYILQKEKSLSVGFVSYRFPSDLADKLPILERVNAHIKETTLSEPNDLVAGTEFRLFVNNTWKQR